MSLDDYNYCADERTQGPTKAPVLYMDDGSVVELPRKREVCPVCEGEGKHVNPSIDAGGLSQEMAGDPDFMEDYLGGMYDVRCNRCKGLRVVWATDWDALSDDQREQYEAQLHDDAEFDAMRLAEIRMGA